MLNPASVQGMELDDLSRSLPVLHFYDSMTFVPLRICSKTGMGTWESQPNVLWPLCCLLQFPSVMCLPIYLAVADGTVSSRLLTAGKTLFDMYHPCYSLKQFSELALILLKGNMLRYIEKKLWIACWALFHPYRPNVNFLKLCTFQLTVCNKILRFLITAMPPCEYRFPTHTDLY